MWGRASAESFDGFFPACVWPFQHPPSCIHVITCPGASPILDLGHLRCGSLQVRFFAMEFIAGARLLRQECVRIILSH